ncbi:CDP-alcohol phosphatidyltransferase family protein [Halomicrobium sp. HM KBTZ05]|nr:CDP-alcohol phosphatidyltransferase family protein [Halomicrobium mukohataei]
MSGVDGEVPPALVRRWAAGVVVAVVGLALGTALLEMVLVHPAAFRWTVGAAVILCFELAFWYYHLGANHRTGGASFETLGAANALTLLRGGLLAIVAGCALITPDPFAPLAWLPAACYGVSVAIDWLDGTVARATDRVTVLGSRLDMAIDTVGFLVAPVVGVLWGQLPVWYLSLSLARYLFKSGRRLRIARGRPVYDLPESRLRRPLAGLQMAFITFALAPVTPPSVVRSLAAVVLVPSLAVFLRDYLAISGRWHNNKR